ncbi:MAG: D-2-hydroxyacid dehydrogenase [Chloroflexota bacterium]
MSDQILVAHDATADRVLPYLRDRLPNTPLAPWTDPRASQAAEVLLWSGGRAADLDQALASLSQLRWLAVLTAGVEHLLTPALLSRGITVTNSKGVYAVTVAESSMAMLLAIAKRLPELFVAQAEHRWEHGLQGDQVRGKTLGIVGLGGIGREAARLAKAFGLRVLGLRRSTEPSEHVDRLLTPAGLPDLLAESDYVLLAAPVTAETRHMIGAAELKMMKPHAWLINVGRGALIDDDALLAALRGGTIGGAALDVFQQEPLPAGHPYWSMPNVIVTPHVANPLDWSIRYAVDFFAENLARFAAGQPLQNQVDLTLGY